MAMRSGNTIRVLIAVGLAMSAKHLARLLMPAEDIAMAATARTSDEAIQLAMITKPDVIIIDPMITTMDILTVIEKLAKGVPGVSILLLTVISDPQVLQRALQAGAKGCLPWPPAGNGLIENIRRLHQSGNHEN
jgi:two-component system response regulator DesR